MYRRKERPASGPLVEAGWCTAVQRLAGLAVYSVQWVYTGTAEARRRLSGTSHTGQSRRRGAVTRVRVMSRCWGRESSDICEHDTDIITFENERRCSAEEIGGFICEMNVFAVIFSTVNIMVFMHSGRH